MPSHSKVVSSLESAQGVEEDQREKALEAMLFMVGDQWEDNAKEMIDGPQYQFDITSPLIKQTSGDMEKMDFGINVAPSSGDADEDVAEFYADKIRDIEERSSARHIYNSEARRIIAAGTGGWMVVQDYVDDSSIDQGILIKPIHNFMDRVWIDTASLLQDGSDAMWGHLLTPIADETYKELYPDGSGLSLAEGRMFGDYYNKADTVTVGDYFWIKLEPSEIVLMSDGSIHEDNEKFASIADELREAGITEVKRRKLKKKVCYRRRYDGGGWLGPEKRTVFNYIPLIPVYGDYEIIQGKKVYSGEVASLMDPQRVFNYSQTREVIEGALAPIKKLMITSDQAAGHNRSLGTYNSNGEPVQQYNHKDGHAPPYETGGPNINPGLRVTTESMKQVIGQIGGKFAASMGDNPGLQSGVAIDLLQDRGENSSSIYTRSMEIAIEHTCRVIVDALPRTIDTEREESTRQEDGTIKNVPVNRREFDVESGEWVIINDLSKGSYSVSCKAGPSFRNKQDAIADSILSYAQIDPSVIEHGGDVLLKNMSLPGMDLLAERKRQQLFQAGLIPESQWTDEEREMMQAASQQEQQPDPNTLIAMAEMGKAEAAQLDAETKAQSESAKWEAKFIELQLKADEADSKREESNRAFALQLEQIAAGVEKTNAETLKLIREATGADAIVSGPAIEAFNEQAEDL